MEKAKSGEQPAQRPRELDEVIGELEHRIEILNLRLNASEEENLRLREENNGLKSEVKTLEELSTYDPLTGILNRRGGLEKIDFVTAKYREQVPETEKREPEKRKTARLSFLMVDIDHFKNINDTYGHPGGDEVLKKVAEFLKSSIRKYDFAVRWGGEEFLIVFQETEAQKILNNKFFDKDSGKSQISLNVEIEIEKDDGKQKITIPVTLSGGVTNYRPGEDVKEAINRADKALYESKRQGRNRITLADNK